MSIHCRRVDRSNGVTLRAVRKAYRLQLRVRRSREALEYGASFYYALQSSRRAIWRLQKALFNRPPLCKLPAYPHIGAVDANIDDRTDNSVSTSDN
jgi:hypothetical protein